MTQPLSTVTDTEAVWPVALQVAVIVAVPKPFGVTTPKSTVAMFSSLEVQSTEPVVALAGV